MALEQFKTLVVGIDFSRYSKMVVRQAVLLSQHSKAKLVFVYALSTMEFTAGESPGLSLQNEFIDPLIQEIRQYYKLNDLPESCKFDIEIKVGRATDAILSVAEDCVDPLIIVGHKGESTAMGRFFIGSTAEQIALRARNPVWIHRGNQPIIPYKILLPCDYSAETEKSYQLASNMFNGKLTEFEFFHVTQPPHPLFDAREWKTKYDLFKKTEQSAAARFQKRYPKVTLKTKEGPVAPLLAEEASHFDLIAMASHHNQNLFTGFGSVTAKVVRSGSVPVLITR